MYTFSTYRNKLTNFFKGTYSGERLYPWHIYIFFNVRYASLSAGNLCQVTHVSIHDIYILFNVKVCIVIGRNTGLHSAMNYYLICLAISDLVIILLGIVYSTLQTIFDLCIPKKDLAKPHSHYQLNICHQNYIILLGIMIFCWEVGHRCSCSAIAA